MKKKIDKDLANHWLMPYINYHCCTFYGLSLSAFRFILSQLRDNVNEEDKISISGIGVLPLGVDTFCLSLFVFHDPDDMEFITSRPLKCSTLKKYGRLFRGSVGFYRYEFYSI